MNKNSTGFLLRGKDITRLETFADAAFAFTVTMLVISLDEIPSTPDELVQALKGVPAFAVSFILIMMFWRGHLDWSRKYGLEDNRSIVLTALLVFVALVYVYPLKLMFSAMFYHFSGGWLPSAFAISSFADLRTLFVIYGLGFAAMSLALLLLYRHALIATVTPELTPAEQYETRSSVGVWLIMTACGLLSVTLALVLPDRQMAWGAGMIYSTLAFLMPGYATYRARKARDLALAG